MDYSDYDFCEGTISTKAVLEANKRKVYKVLISQKKHTRNMSYIISLAKSKDIEIEFCDKSVLDEITSNSAHGGIVALISERKYEDFSDLIKKDKPFLAILEGIEDPFNFAYCLRSLYAAGCDGVIVSKRNWLSASSVVIKSSAGASEFINMYKTYDISDTIIKLKDHGLKLFVGHRKDAKSIYDTKFNEALIIAIGGEKRGLSRTILDLADQHIYIPYANDFKNAINGSSATAIISFEIFRQRGEYGKKL